MNNDVPVIDWKKPFRLNGRLVQASNMTFINSGYGQGTFRLDGVCLYEERPYIDVDGSVVDERQMILDGAPALNAGFTPADLVIVPDVIQGAPSELVKFHVRGMRYMRPFRSDDGDYEDGFDTLDEALGFISYREDYGASCCHEIWIGDEMIHDSDSAFQLMLAYQNRIESSAA